MRSKPKPLNYCIFAIVISGVFTSLIVFGKDAVAFGALSVCVAAVVLNWRNSRKPMHLRRPTLCEAVSLVIVALAIVAHVSVAVSVRRRGADLSPYFLDNNVFLISVWLIILLVPLRRMLRPEDGKETSDG